MRSLACVPLVLVLLGGCGRARGWPLDTVKDVDFNKYAGTWFEIGAFPQIFEHGCINTRAEYIPRTSDASSIDVINSCDRNKKRVEQRGVATVLDLKDPGKLSVAFDVPIVGHVKGDYYIVALDTDYRWAMVGTPSREDLWVLSRAPDIDTGVLASLIIDAEDLGYNDVRSRFKCTEQPGGFAKTCASVVNQ